MNDILGVMEEIYLNPGITDNKLRKKFGNKNVRDFLNFALSDDNRSGTYLSVNMRNPNKRGYDKLYLNTTGFANTIVWFQKIAV